MLRQVSPKCDFDYGFSMEFENQEAYEAYNAHPSHRSFVQERWETEVARFQEIDLVE
ncbi:Dabb family protein [Paenibacillus albidus]|uniref:Dabb family protein n=1 Tax=Paenibacillus albidus TaxID=2041023 RepID=UPI001BE7C437|nr:Dabb family protein [Paenibacillus albidus]MBT2287929.1 Dabb family protein [Paenibacillus albidus]